MKLFELRSAGVARCVAFVWCVCALVAIAATAVSTAPRTPIRVGVPERDNIQYLSLWVALGAGYFQQEGLDPSLVVADRGNQSGRLLMQQEADIALLQPPVFLGLMAQQRPIVLFANLLANDPINLIVRADVARRTGVDPRAPLADRLKALKGLRIGVANEPPRRLRAMFAEAGLDADRDIQMTIIPGEEQFVALKDGVVDGLYIHTPFLEDAIVTLGAVLVVNQSAGEVAAVANGQIHSLATTRAFAESHPEVLLAAARAIASAQRLIRSDPAAAAKAMEKAGISAPSPKHLATIVALYRAAVPQSPQVSAAAVERDAVLYPARPETPDFTRIHVADFLAPAFAEQASSR